MKNVLIVRGVQTADDLKSFGLPMAQRFADADTVVGIARDGHARAIKCDEQLDVSFVDGASAFSEIAEIMNEIKAKYLASAEAKNHHLMHAVVGMWLFYWIHTEGEKVSPTPIQMIEFGDIDGLRASARSFIEADFGFAGPVAGSIPEHGGADTEGA